MPHLKTIVRYLSLVLAVLAALTVPVMADAKVTKVTKPAAAKPVTTALPAVTSADHVMGDPNAKLTVIEYGSVACPACAHFNETAFPAFKAKYVDTGKVRYVFRPMLTGVQAVAMAGTQMAECAGKDKYFSVVDAVMRGQHEYYPTGETDIFAHAVLVKIAKAHGMDEAAFNACVLDADVNRRVNQANADAWSAGVRATPTFFVNGKKLEGDDNLDATVAAQLK